MKLKIFSGIALLSLSTLSHADLVYGTDVNPRTSSCIRNNNCLISSSHWAHVINDTDQIKTVYVIYSICPEAEKCKSDRYKIVVRPRGDWQDGKNMVTNARYHYTGDRAFTATTTLMELTGQVLKTDSKRGKILVNG